MKFLLFAVVDTPIYKSEQRLRCRAANVDHVHRTRPHQTITLCKPLL